MKTTRFLSLMAASAVLFFPSCESGAGEAGAEEEVYNEGEGLGAEEGLEGEETADYGTWDGWDANDDNYVDDSEWGTGYEQEGLFTDWDVNADNQIGEQEYYETSYGLWDENDDEGLTEDEWGENANTWFGDADYGTWDDWDTNGDDRLDYNEYQAGYENYGLYDNWDTTGDGNLDENEVRTGVYSTYDYDDDNMWNEEEWGTYNEDFATL